MVGVATALAALALGGCATQRVFDGSDAADVGLPTARRQAQRERRRAP
jgi:hypothetical protein